MDHTLQFVAKHGYSVVFAAVFLRQLGLPAPGPPVLLAAGALVAAGEIEALPALALAVIACVLGDWVLYEGGRRCGEQLLLFFHRFTRNREAADRYAKEGFTKHGPPILLVAKFIPGLNTVAPPLTGMSGTGRLRFLTFESLGALVYALSFGALGYFFSQRLDRAAAYVGRGGILLTAIALGAVGVFLVRRLRHRQQIARGAARSGYMKDLPARPGIFMELSRTSIRAADGLRRRSRQE